MKTILSIFFISLISFASYAQEEWDPTDHQIATWQFRSINPSDVANFLSNEDNVYRQAVKNAIAEGRMKHWGLLRKVNGNTSDNHNFFFYNGFENLTDIDNSWWVESGPTFGLKPVQSQGVLGSAHTFPAIQVFATNPKPGNYIKVNYANPTNVNEFVRLQNEIWKPFIKKYVNDSESSWAGWEVHQVVSPTGSGYNWSIATVDHFTTLSGALNSFPDGAEWPEGLEAINDLLPDGKFYKSVIYEVVFYEGTEMSK